MRLMSIVVLLALCATSMPAGAAEPVDAGPADCARAYPADKTFGAAKALYVPEACYACPRGFAFDTDALSGASNCVRKERMLYREATNHGKKRLLKSCGSGRFAEEGRCWSCPKGWSRAPLRNDGIGQASCKRFISYKKVDAVDRGAICGEGYMAGQRCYECPEGSSVERTLGGLGARCRDDDKPKLQVPEKVKEKIRDGLKGLPKLGE